MDPLNTDNYFELFSIPETYHVNIQNLTERYRKLQAQVHPDRVAGGSDQERIHAIQATSLINEAYQSLRSAQTRAAYLLTLRGVDVERVDQSDLDPELLLEQIRLREALDEVPREEGSIDRLETMRADIEERLERARRQFSDAFDREELQAAKKSYFEMQYLSKLVIEIESVEEDLLGY